MNLLAIVEVDLNDGEADAIMVIDDPDKIDNLIKKKYGEYLEISHKDINELNAEWIKVIEVRGVEDDPYRVRLSSKRLKLNEVCLF